MAADENITSGRTSALVSARIVIAVPLYNESPYIEETLRSLARQQDADFKVLIADNASDDGSREICESFVSSDDRFTYVRHPDNFGAARNFAFCLEASSSDYFMWCGAHDVLTDNFLSSMAATLDSSPTTAIAFGSRAGIDEDSNPIEAIDHDDGYIYRFSSFRVLRYLQAACALADCTIVNGMFRRRDLDGFNFLPVRSLDMVLLSHLLYFGTLQYDATATYFRRYFEFRPGTQGDRISGKGPATAMDDRSLVEYFASDISRLLASSTSSITRLSLRFATMIVRLRYAHAIGRHIRFVARLQVQPMRTHRSLRLGG